MIDQVIQFPKWKALLLLPFGVPTSIKGHKGDHVTNESCFHFQAKIISLTVHAYTLWTQSTLYFMHNEVSDLGQFLFKTLSFIYRLK